MIPSPFMQGNDWILRVGVRVTCWVAQTVRTVGTSNGAVEKKAMCE